MEMKDEFWVKSEGGETNRRLGSNNREYVWKESSFENNFSRKEQSDMTILMVYINAGFEFFFLAHEWSQEAVDKMSTEKKKSDFYYIPNRTTFINYDYAEIKDMRKFVPPDEEGVDFTV
jgi:hypothetical protein